MAAVASARYGKDKVRLVRVVRLPPDPAAPHLQRDAVHEWTVRVLLKGAAFAPSFTRADNALVVPTDTVKNTVYVLAKTRFRPAPELFARELADHFLARYAHVAGVDVDIAAHKWTRIQATTLAPVHGVSSGTFDGREAPAERHPHPHSFVRDGDEKRFCRLEALRGSGTQSQTRYALSGGWKDVYVLKTTGSAFTGFHRCENTTLQDAADRMFSTTIKMEWAFPENPDFAAIPFDEYAASCKQVALDIFANHDSPSVQNTLFLTGEVLLGKCPAIASISFSLPNKHVFTYNLAPFGLDNTGKNCSVFYPVTDPSGLISATIVRKTPAKL